MKITFLLPLLGHPRLHKRIRMLRAAGAEVEVLAFERPALFKARDVGEYRSLGRLEDGNYLGRVTPYLSAVKTVRDRAVRSDVLYCFSADLLGLGSLAIRGLASPPRLVCEVADIRALLVGEGPRAELARRVERRVIRMADLVVVTSEAFVRGFYEGVQGVQGLPWFLLENKVDASVLEAPEPPSDSWDGVLRIVYSGLMCCTRSWDVLDRVAREGGERVQVRLHGVLQAGLERLAEECQDRPNVEYLGPFESPRELPEVFGAADLVWIAHAYGVANQAWSRANRFYQAGFFYRPMVAQRGTEDGRIVESRGLGPLVDLHEPEQAVRTLLSIKAEQVEGWRVALREEPRESFVITDEHSRLLERLAR